MPFRPLIAVYGETLPTHGVWGSKDDPENCFVGKKELDGALRRGLRVAGDCCSPVVAAAAAGTEGRRAGTEEDDAGRPLRPRSDGLLRPAPLLQRVPLNEPPLRAASPTYTIAKAVALVYDTSAQRDASGAPRPDSPRPRSTSRTRRSYRRRAGMRPSQRPAALWSFEDYNPHLSRSDYI
ncbi:hypothetical protein BRADI_1g22121v3 [Brachypodium distachyon]|uniref:Uncharacterized protein n=1 Tax=Brachypodium distachyon TaxID=15368 RepID=A0A0Q3JTH0_BRADI|nr:hypothetical protein BRADI_1g22121v3 [Brachypodium distachyon]